MTGCQASVAHLHTYCFAMSQSLGLLLVALQSFRSLKKLKLDFTAFSSCNRAVQLDADGLMALDCLWRQVEDLLTANGPIRFGAAFAFHQSIYHIWVCCRYDASKGVTNIRTPRRCRVCMVFKVSCNITGNVNGGDHKK